MRLSLSIGYEKPISSYCVVQYFWWGCRRNLKLITVEIEGVRKRSDEGLTLETSATPFSPVRPSRPQLIIFSWSIMLAHADWNILWSTRKGLGTKLAVGCALSYHLHGVFFPFTAFFSQSDESKWFNAAGILLSLKNAAMERRARQENLDEHFACEEIIATKPPRATERTGKQPGLPETNHVTHMQFEWRGSPEEEHAKAGRRDHHGNDANGNQCRICLKVYARPSTLRMHMRTHRGEKPYKCQICFKSFTQDANLTAHLRIHSGEKPFKCQVCDRRYDMSRCPLGQEACQGIISTGLSTRSWWGGWGALRKMITVTIPALGLRQGESGAGGQRHSQDTAEMGTWWCRHLCSVRRPGHVKSI